MPANVYLEDLFPRFWSKWKEQRDEVTTVIEYYVNSKAMQQAGLPKDAVATSYAGLDLLASLVLEEPDKDDSVANVSKALKCFDIPNRVLKKSEIPITTQLSHDLSVGKSGPHLIYSVRNYVVHPLDRDKDAIKKLHLEHLDENYSPYLYLHDLSQFYLEYLFLVGLCHYIPQDYRPLIERLEHRRYQANSKKPAPSSKTGTREEVSLKLEKQ